MTRAEIKTWVKNMGFGTDTDAQQNDMLLRALQEIEGRRDWKWMETQGIDNLAIPLGASHVAYPTGVSEIKEIAISVVGQSRFDRPLEKLNLDRITEYLHEDRVNAAPRYWSSDFSGVFIYPRADQAYTASTIYIQKTATSAFSADGHVPPFDDRFHIILGWRCLMWLLFRERDWFMYDRASAEYDKLAREMEQKDESDRRNTHMERSSYWSYVK